MEDETARLDTARADYSAFEDKVKRSVYIDNLSPQATEAVVRHALNQFGSVVNIRFIPNYLNPSNTPSCALVEMENEKQAKNIINVTTFHPFMILGMPRPAKAHAAVKEMYDDRPAKPSRKIHCQWLDQNDPDFATANKLKQLVRKHAAESSYVLNRQREIEEKLAQEQFVALKANYKKLESTEAVLLDGAAIRLAEKYRVNIRHD